MIKGKNGWIRIVEAFLAVSLIGVILVLIINNQQPDTGFSERAYEDEAAILRAIETNETLRTSIINIADASLPMKLAGFPADVKAKIENEIPSYLECDAQICTKEQSCVIDGTSQKETYVGQVGIFSNLQNYKPRKLVLSCSVKE